MPIEIAKMIVPRAVAFEKSKKFVCPIWDFAPLKKTITTAINYTRYAI